MMPLARFFYLATWHEALAITKEHFIEATGSACRAVALVSYVLQSHHLYFLSIFICYSYLFILISPSQVTGLLYCVATATCAVSSSEIFLMFFRLSKGIPPQGVLQQWLFCVQDIQYQVLMSAWVPTIPNNRFFWYSSIMFGAYHEPDVKQVTNTTCPARCNLLFIVISYIISQPVNALFRNVVQQPISKTKLFKHK